MRTEIILVANPSALRLFQVKAEDIVGFRESQLLIVSDIDRTDFSRPYISEIPKELIILRRDNSEVFVEIRSAFLTFKNRQCFMESFRDIGNHKHAEEDLKNSLQHFRLHIENTPLAVVGFDNQFKINLWSAKAEKLFGWTAEEVTGKHIFEFKWIHDNDLDNVNGLIDDMLNMRQASIININRNYRKDGSVITCEWYNSVLSDDKGRPVSLQCMIQDITGREELELKLTHSHNLMQYIIEHSRSAIAVHDKELRYIFVSTPYLIEYNVKAKDIIGRHHYEIFPDLPQKWRDVHQRALKGEICSAEDDPYERADGTIEWTRWECRPWFESDGSIGGIVVYTEVITKKKEEELELIKAKEKAERSEERYRLFIEQTTEGIYSLDLKPPVKTNLPVEEMIDYIYDHAFMVECNNAMLKMYNAASRDDIIGKTLLDFHGGRDNEINRENLRKFVLNNFRIQNMETIETDVKGDIHYFSNNTVGFVENDLLVRIWGTQSDITEKKRYEIELLNAKEKAEESDRLKTAFLQNMSHEVRTPLNTVVGFSQLLVESYGNKNQKYYSEMITTGSDKLIRIISDVIEISQIKTSQVKLTFCMTNVDSVINKIIGKYSETADKKNIILRYSSRINSCPGILTDAIKLEKILTHLIDNAIKFTDGPGLVEVLSTILNGNVHISITDTGIGIPDDMQKVIFEPFRQIETELTRTYGGNGLGLTLAKEYTELLHGRLVLNSAAGKGTTIEIEIPVSAEKILKENTVTKNVEKMRTRAGTVLVVEDEYSSFKYLQELLKSENMNVLHAGNGKEAVELCRNHDFISLILMDIKMPVMDGTTSAKIIRSIKPGIPIIAQTAFAVESERETYMNLFDDLLSKPIRKNEFRKMLNKFITGEINT